MEIHFIYYSYLSRKLRTKKKKHIYILINILQSIFQRDSLYELYQETVRIAPTRSWINAKNKMQSYFFVGHRKNSDNVRRLHFPEASESTFQFQSGESVRHFPELNVSRAGGDQLIVNERRKPTNAHVLSTGLGPQNYHWFFPIPNRKRVVRFSSLWTQQLAVSTAKPERKLIWLIRMNELYNNIHFNCWMIPSVRNTV